MINVGYVFELAVAVFLAYRVWDLFRKARARIRHNSVIRLVDRRKWSRL
jgi:hypothetical protein